MHPLLRLIATRPALLAEHAEAYAALIAVEAPRISSAWQRSALLNVLALVSLTVGATLAGVGAMLWAAAPDAPMRASWALIATPLAPLLVGIACAVAARTGRPSEAVENLRRQFAADLLMLREAAPV